MHSATSQAQRQRRFALRMAVLFTLLALVLVVIAGTVVRTVNALLDANAVLNHTHQVREQIVTTIATLRDTEAAQRAYALTGDSERLASAYATLPRILEHAARLHELTTSNADQNALAQQLEGVLKLRHELIGRSLATDRSTGAPVLTSAQLGVAKQQDTQVGELAQHMLAAEDRLLAQREASSAGMARHTRLLTISAIAFCSILLAIVALLLLREQGRRARIEQRMAVSNAELEASLGDSRRLANTLHRLSDLGQLLQGCRSLDEAAQGLRGALTALFPATAGSVSLMNASQNLVDRLCHWGEAGSSERAFAPDECWALRLGHAYPEDDSTAPFVCRHLGDTPPGAHLCVPLFAQGATLGTLQLSRTTPFDHDARTAATAAAEQVGLAIANLQLQETLRTQSLRDPLTGLFNRRYLEASLARDLARAIRNNQPLAVLMLDIDHFKRFNDQHGHDAGDALLAQFGQLVASLARSEDVVCRYGGEEFTIVLQDADAALALDRAEDIRHNVEAMKVLHRQRDLGQVTVSIGIASYPQHGDTQVQLLHRADRALYSSKHSGRNRVSVADRT